MLVLLKGPVEPELPPQSQPEAEVARPSVEKRWLCAGCDRPITDDDARMEVDGAHVHVRINPVGVVYRFGCFDRADCVISDQPTLENTWFPGSAWQYAHCPGCALHLGWFFGGFFGLVLDRLVRPE